jgi:hypothetical protein
VSDSAGNSGNAIRTVVIANPDPIVNYEINARFTSTGYLDRTNVTNHPNLFTKFRPSLDQPWSITLDYDMYNDNGKEQYLFMLSDGTTNNSIALSLGPWVSNLRPKAVFYISGQEISATASTTPDNRMYVNGGYVAVGNPGVSRTN